VWADSLLSLCGTTLLNDSQNGGKAVPVTGGRENVFVGGRTKINRATQDRQGIKKKKAKAWSIRRRKGLSRSEGGRDRREQAQDLS